MSDRLFEAPASSHTAAPRADRRCGLCVQITVSSPPAFRIFYATGWDEVVLHYRQLGEDGTALGEVA